MDVIVINIARTPSEKFIYFHAFIATIYCETTLTSYDLGAE